MVRNEKRNPTGRGRDFGMALCPSETWAPQSGSKNYASSVAPSSARNDPCTDEYSELRFLLEETASQALTQGPLFKRSRLTNRALPGRDNHLISLPFPKKLWITVNSNQFASIWWDCDGTYIGINEKLFEKEILEREGPNKIFETDCMKSFIRQLNLYGFSKIRQDDHKSVCLTNFFTEERPVCIVNKVEFYYSPCFKRDSPHLLTKMKRRVGIKTTSRQTLDKASQTMESKSEFPKSPPTPAATKQQEDPMPLNENHQEILENQELDKTTQIGNDDSAPPETPQTEPEPTVASHEAAENQLAEFQGQPVRIQAPVPPYNAAATTPPQVPFVYYAMPPAQMTSYGLMVGLPAILPRHPAMPTRQLPLASLLPFWNPWMPVPVMSIGPAASMPVFLPSPLPYHCWANCHYFCGYMPTFYRLLMSPECRGYHM
ncbi:heat shock transcription factor, X-linked-like [Dasypus novemcinctus]|uniref:heat shock transcription factor, X-linked-like n=1 Tax=Dasypus novemcinctus TaxID=9361 RepID=UPI0003289530|nr:heat shock transcription factor, X-linked-like [Dasypus novemcinctus]